MSVADTRQQTAAPPFPPPGWAGVGTCTLTAAETVAPRLLPYHLLLLGTAGHGTVNIDFVAHRCRPGTLLWIRPDQALHLSEPGLDAALVTFEPRLGRELGGGHPTGQDEPTGPDHWQLEGEDEDAVISEFTQLAVDCDRHLPGPVTAALLHHQLAVVLFRIALLTEPPPDSPERRTFARFRRLLEDGHPSSRRVEDYADRLRCSVRTLTRASLAVAGRTAKQVVDDRVALQARRLLACSPLSIAEVGRRLGFPEPTNFGRFFHREVGISPGQFRAEFAGRTVGIIPVQRPPHD
jgi:AraC-like DNA-binding protein